MTAAAANSAAGTDGSRVDEPLSAQDRSRYRESLRSSAIVGGSSAINMLIGLVRTKVMAMLLGPAGVGLIGALTSIVDLARTLAELGINNSGVRQIAESVGTGDTARIARTATVLRRVALALGLLGGLLLAAMAVPVSTVTFGDQRFTWAVAFLGLALFFRLVADAQAALLQGMRRIGDLARINVYSALASTLLAIACVFWLGENGIVLGLVGGAAASLAVSWGYSRRARISAVTVPRDELLREARALLRLGLAFMTSALLTVGAAYIVRLILIRGDGLEGAGLYQAAWAVGSLFVSFVLQAMGTDFYPRLVAAASNDTECNRLVNEQAMVSLLMAGMGVVATLTLAPWVVTLLYSEKFAAATELLRWICLGMALRVVTWPLGYILVAKGKQAQFVTADLLWTVMNVGLTWLCFGWFGLTGAGVAFFASYLLHVVVVYPMCRSVSGFRWSRQTGRVALAFVVVIAAVHVGFLLLPPAPAMALGVLATVASTIASTIALSRLVAPQHVPARLAWLLRMRRNPRQ